MRHRVVVVSLAGNEDMLVHSEKPTSISSLAKSDEATWAAAKQANLLVDAASVPKKLFKHMLTQLECAHC